MKKISVIVPIYQGQKYIKGIVKQLEKAIKAVEYKVIVELMLVNDDPKDRFCKGHQSKLIDIRMLETDKNRGIHGARVRGLQHCTGQYVVFLDQDDRIFPGYLKSQMNLIDGGADAVVCRALNGGKEFYNHDKNFEAAVSFSHMLTVGNGILSPGQVLLRKDCASSVWQEHILKHNGADDWLLWLCMMNEGRSFSLNQEVLYEHVINGDNCSESAVGMYASEKEVYEVLRKSGCFNDEYIDAFAQAVHRMMEVRLLELDQLKQQIFIYDTWLTVNREHNAVATYLRDTGYKSIAIYGLSKVGQQLFQTLKQELQVACFIDRNAAFLSSEIPVFGLEDDIPQVDLIILSLVDKGKKISTNIFQRFQVPVISIYDILLKIVRSKE